MGKTDALLIDPPVPERGSHVGKPLRFVPPFWPEVDFLLRKQIKSKTKAPEDRAHALGHERAKVPLSRSSLSLGTEPHSRFVDGSPRF